MTTLQTLQTLSLIAVIVIELSPLVVYYMGINPVYASVENPESSRDVIFAEPLVLKLDKLA